jgi:hypothetical protein
VGRSGSLSQVLSWDVISIRLNMPGITAAALFSYFQFRAF